MAIPKEEAYRYAHVAANKLLIEFLLAELFSRCPDAKRAYEQTRDLIVPAIQISPVPGFDAAWSDLVSQLVQEEIEGSLSRGLATALKHSPPKDAPPKSAS